MPPKISVIVPIYNAERWLRRCVDSILAQTFTDFELLFVDDGSTDASGAICDEYAAKDARIRVFHKANGGVSSARFLINKFTSTYAGRLWLLKHCKMQFHIISISLKHFGFAATVKWLWRKFVKNDRFYHQF